MKANGFHLALAILVRSSRDRREREKLFLTKPHTVTEGALEVVGIVVLPVDVGAPAVGERIALGLGEP